MRIFDLRAPETGGASRHAVALAIGNFDGVHRGHREVIGKVIRVAEQLEATSAIMTFEPYPREYFDPATAPPRLSSCAHKLELLRETGVSRVYCARFGKALASTSANEFVRSILVEQLNVAHVVVGADFRFGAGRTGNVELLRQLGHELHFGVTSVSDFNVADQRVSSSRIRAFLAEGDLDSAAVLLGRPFSWEGRVMHGDKRGRTWGFPTANLAVRRDSFAVSGVFVVRVTDAHGFYATGVANVGRRPTVQGTRLLIEVHLFDFDGDLYGRRIQVTFLHRIRGERRFDSFDALKHQIGDDIVVAKDYLAEQGDLHRDIHHG